MWTEKDNKLTRSFTFDNFVEAFAFMTKVALIAEKKWNIIRCGQMFTTKLK